MLPKEIELFSEYLRRRNYSPHTVCNYGLDLRLFFADIPKVPGQVTWRDVDRFVARQHEQGLAATTINRRLNALRSFYEFLLQEQEGEVLSPVKPSHFLRQGRPLPKKLSGEEVRRLFARITNRMDRALFLLMLRCGLRVSEAAAPEARRHRLGREGTPRQAGQGAERSARLPLARRRGRPQPMPGAAPRDGDRGAVLLEPEAAPGAAYGQGDPEEDGALREGRRGQGELPQLAPHLRLQPPGGRGRGGLDQRIPRPREHRLE
jgi:hypothetical protein